MRTFPPAQRAVDEAGDAVQLLGVDERTHLGVVARRVANDKRAHGRHQVGEQVVVDGRAGDDPGGRGAVLAGVEEAADLDALDDGGQVGVVEDDHGRLAAQLEVDPLERVRGRLGDRLAGSDVAGQRDHAHPRVADKPGPNRLAVAGDHVEHARGKDVGCQLGHPERGEGRPLGGLQTTVLPAAKGRSELPGRHQQRVVPGRDRADHAQGLATHPAGQSRHVLTGGTAFQGPGGSGEEAEAVGDRRDLLGEGRGERLADVLRLDPSQLLAVGLDHVGELEETLAAVPWGAVEPDLVVGLSRRRNGLVDVLRGSPWGPGRSPGRSPG